MSCFCCIIFWWDFMLICSILFSLDFLLMSLYIFVCFLAVVWDVLMKFVAFCCLPFWWDHFVKCHDFCGCSDEIPCSCWLPAFSFWWWDVKEVGAVDVEGCARFRMTWRDVNSCCSMIVGFSRGVWDWCWWCDVQMVERWCWSRQTIKCTSNVHCTNVYVFCDMFLDCYDMSVWDVIFCEP